MGRTASAVSARSAATTSRESGLSSASLTAMAIGAGWSDPAPPPNSEPKKAAVAIGARIERKSARRFEK